MKIFKRSKLELGAMANVAPHIHGIPNIKMNVLQGDDARISKHGLRVKIFKFKNIRNSVLVDINRSKGTLKIKNNGKSELTKKELDNSINFIKENWRNFLTLWTDETSVPDELTWIKNERI